MGNHTKNRYTPPMWIDLTDKAERRDIKHALATPLFYGVLAVALAMLAIFSPLSAKNPVEITTWIFLACVLSLLTVVDLRTMTLPDILTIPTTILGLIFAPLVFGMPLWAGVLGVGLAVVALGGLEIIMTRLLGRPALGWGDVKLLALFGAWGGVFALPLILVLASWSALIFIIGARLAKKLQKRQAFPFGPFLVLSGWLVLLFQPLLWEYIYKIGG